MLTLDTNFVNQIKFSSRASRSTNSKTNETHCMQRTRLFQKLIFVNETKKYSTKNRKFKRSKTPPKHASAKIVKTKQKRTR